MKAWKLGMNVSGGHALESDGGRWLWVQGEAQHKWGKAGVFWLDYHENFDYGTVGAQLTPEFKLGNTALTLLPHATLARWNTQGLSSTYGVLGAALQWTRTLSEKSLIRVTGSSYSSGDNGYASGAYFALAGEAFTQWRGTTLGVGAMLGDNPNEGEAGFMMWASRPFGQRLRVDAMLARTISDAVFGTPGNLGFTLAASWRILHREPAPPVPLASVGDAVTRGRLVLFTVKVPDAKTVAVSGTFTDWRPVALKRTGAGDVWTGSVTIEPGTHQFGFLIDGENWFVPADAKDVIDDGFGRKNVTLVVRPK